ncbi:MAG: sulfate reduction electron transfer complex DsrMKJOP subunit DsrM [Nitrospiraceae bacterium]|nr:MAG: sulfate reduction electron transfer complex DsrMKJOP subunit DsrM [Nitrospiraceae bacterium]
MGIFFSFSVVVALTVIAFAGVWIPGMQYFFGVVIPYLAVLVFLVGVVLKVAKWGRSPVPFRIPTTCGQQQSLPWIKHSKYDNPQTTGQVIIRMVLEVFLFRSLFRNLRTEMNDGRVTYGSDKILWLAGLLFHISFFIVLIRHLRFFIEPVPSFINMIDALDGFVQVGVPHLLLTGVLLVAAGGYLLFRRINNSQVRHISLPADYFPLLLIIGIALSGIIMRYFVKVDIVSVKAFTLGLVSLRPRTPAGIGAIFYIHLFLISALLVYFPFSKLMHMGGVFLSPTRNLANNNREVRHVNPWNYDVKVHSYAAYEDEFREKMKEAGIPVEKE